MYALCTFVTLQTSGVHPLLVAFPHFFFKDNTKIRMPHFRFTGMHTLRKKISPLSQPSGSHGYEVLATSFSQPRHMRAGSQFFPSLSHHPTDSVRSVYSSQPSWLGGAGGTRNLEPNFCPGPGLNPEPHDWQSSTLTTRLPCNQEKELHGKPHNNVHLTPH